MDPVTHGLVGATFSQTFADKGKFRAASLTGFASALLADADVFISSSSDPLFNIEMHRHFMHSFLFTPVGALFASVLLWFLVRKRLTFTETYLFSLLGYTSAILMDYVTSYGVHLFWPFADERYSLDIISVFDPVFTLGILTLTVIAFYNYEKRFARYSLIWIVVYLSLGFIQQNRATDSIESITANLTHPLEKIVAKPTIANQLLWNVRYISDDTVYSYGVRLMPFSKPKIYTGESAPLLNWKEAFSDFENTTLYDDIQRFSKLSDGWLIKHPKYTDVIGDARYSMLPTTLSPLWGITIDSTHPNNHVSFDTYRDTGPEIRRAYQHMLLGRHDE
jgi:inner membrane protein